MCIYNKAKIYKITSGDLVYYGSTTETIERRFNKHKANKKLFTDGRNRNCSVFQIINNLDCKIELIENFPCETKIELLERERFYILNNICINKNIPLSNSKEWAKRVDYYNSDKQKEYRSQSFICECGGRYKKCDKWKHLKSQKHIKFSI